MANERAKSRRRQTDKLLAEWFWTDAWTGSRGHSLPMEPRGLYREMLTQAWRREAKLPNDHEEIRRIVGCSEKEWKRCWPKVAQFWIEDPGDPAHLVNVTQVVVYLEAKAAQADAQARAQAGAHAMHKQRASKAQASAQALPSVSVSDRVVGKELQQPKREPPAVNARSKHPIFKGQRLVVFDWMLEDLRRMLGDLADPFELDAWFYTLDEETAKAGVIVPQRDSGKWLYDRTLEEAVRRGLPIVIAQTKQELRRSATSAQLDAWAQS